MTQIDSALEERIKRYLFDEMAENERSAFEDEYFNDDELFVETMETENRLVDLYVGGKLVGTDLIRLQNSIEGNSGLASKIANARVLRTVILEQHSVEEETTAPQPSPEKISVWQRLATALRLANPAVGFSLAAFLVVLSVLTLILFAENRRKSEEIAKLREISETESAKKQRELEEQLSAATERIEQIKRESEIQSAEGDRVLGELQAATEDKERVQAELDRLRREKKQTPTPERNAGPTIATFILVPTFAARGGGISGGSRTLIVPENSSMVSLRLALPEEVKPDEILSVVLNAKTIRENVQARKSVQIQLNTRDLNEGVNRLSLQRTDGREAAKYVFTLNRK